MAVQSHTHSCIGLYPSVHICEYYEKKLKDASLYSPVIVWLCITTSEGINTSITYSIHLPASSTYSGHSYQLCPHWDLNPVLLNPEFNVLPIEL